MVVRRRHNSVSVTAPGFGVNYAQAAMVILPPAWTVNALCSQTDPEAFFPEKGGSTLEAKAMCRRCPVSFECLEYALANEERYGIWGGASERERRKLKRKGSIA